MDYVHEILKEPSVARVRLDMCRVGMESHWHGKGGERGPVLKPTGMMTSPWCLQLELDLRCKGGHAHVHLVGGRASAAQEYPRDLCEAICRGIAEQKRQDVSRKFVMLPMCEKRVSSLASLCCEASGAAGTWPKAPVKTHRRFSAHLDGWHTRRGWPRFIDHN